MKEGNVIFQSSLEALTRGFEWAKQQALFYVHGEESPAGKWYEAALPGRNAFCMRDVSHQADGAAALGLQDHTKNMMRLFVQSISKEKDYCGYWEITGDGVPCPDDYENDGDFWYNLPGSFEVILTCYKQYLWTGDEVYVREPDFLRFYRQSCEELVALWDKDGDGVTEHYPQQGRRGIASYNETDISVKAGGDMIASQYAAYGCMAEICRLNGDEQAAAGYLERQQALKKQYLEKWSIGEGKGFYGALRMDGTFWKEYAETGNFLPIYFGMLDGEPQMREAIGQARENAPSNVECRSYYPQIFYRTGNYEEGMEWLLSLCDPGLARREYPEVSYAVVGTVVNWLMGVCRQADGTIRTCSALPENEWAKLRQLPIGNGQIHVAHYGRTETVFENRGERAVRWKAAFLGYHENIICGGEKLTCSHEVNAAGEQVSFVTVQVGPGMKSRAKTI